jgi:hypothetical protein
MSEFKGTNEKVQITVVRGVFFLSVENDGKCIGRLYIDELTPTLETNNNAKLIIDAFKVRQTINCELSELLELNKEMLAMLEKCKNSLNAVKEQMIKPSQERDTFWISSFLHSEIGGAKVMRETEQLIKKVKDNV